ncbi:MAG: hypothetical protein DHS20C15_01580 [Planctomycetota bacterium]|nr:MAG: hypothetical protein DHS20C15_01580 [Planctomycetota bacterium]
MNALLLITRLVLGGLFLWMGAQKISDPVVFLKLIREYEMLPERPPLALNSVAVMLPWLEVLCGGLLVLGVAVRGAALVVFGMLAVFSTAILLRALQIQSAEEIAFCAVAFDCGCGAGPQPVCNKLLQNAGLLLASLLITLRGGGLGCLRASLFGSAPGPTPAK